jgi:hypothetical protein
LLTVGLPDPRQKISGDSQQEDLGPFLQEVDKYAVVAVIMADSSLSHLNLYPYSDGGTLFDASYVS